MSDLWELHPHLEGAYIHMLEDAYEAHKAASRIMRIANTPAPFANLTADQLAQRKALLNIPFHICVNERNNALDTFCRAWVKLRGMNDSPP